MKKSILFSAAALALFAACGDEITEVNETTGIKMIASGDTLSDCESSNAGAMVYVTDSSAVYYCAEGKWQVLNGAAGSDGKDGENGKDGTPSKDTVVISKVDTINHVDTLVVLDTIRAFDTTLVFDTTVVKDTLVKIDTIYSKDTVYSIDTLYVTKKIPSVQYDCSEYNCVTTAYLNPAIQYGELLDERDNRVYRTVQIGSQTWMAQSLAYEDSVSSPNLKGQIHCFYDSTAFCETYGRIYSWSAVMNLPSAATTTSVKSALQYPHRGICPEGYHVPDSLEWQTLIAFVDEHNGAEGVGTSLKSPYLWKTRDSVALGTDLFGFSVIPGDDYSSSQKSTIVPGRVGYDDGVGRAALFWSATEVDANKAVRLRLFFENDTFQSNGVVSKKDGKQLRCLKD